jgi:AbrB family looped-hinge helix DNA binding protein
MKKKQQNYMSTVKVGQKGQIVIPKQIRDMFDIEYGDSLIILADIKRGIGLQKTNILSKIADAIFSGKGKEIYPNEKEEHLEIFASEIKKSLKNEEEEE